MSGREMLMLSVEYPPGAVEHIHRHDAYAFVYVLEGTIVEGVRGGKEVTLTPGLTFYEGPQRRAHDRAQREHDEASKVRRGFGEEEGRRRGAARRVVLAFLESDPLAMAKGRSPRAYRRTCRGLRDEHERDRTHTCGWRRSRVVQEHQCRRVGEEEAPRTLGPDAVDYATRLRALRTRKPDASLSFVRAHASGCKDRTKDSINRRWMGDHGCI